MGNAETENPTMTTYAAAGVDTAEGARANIGAASQATADELSGKINNLSVQCTDDGEGNITLTFGV